MSGGEVKVDATAFLDALKQYQKDAETNAEGALKAVGDEVVRVMKQNAPSRTGKMRESIKHEPGRDRRGPYTKVSVGQFYASFVEWGTRNEPARPFFRPALEQARRAFARFRR